MMGLIGLAMLFWGLRVILSRAGKLPRQGRHADSSRIIRTADDARPSVGAHSPENLVLTDIPKKPWQVLGGDIEWQWPLGNSHEPGSTFFSAYKGPVEPVTMPLGLSGYLNLRENHVDLPVLAGNGEIGGLARPTPSPFFAPTSRKKRRRRTIVSKLERCESKDGKAFWRWE